MILAAASIAIFVAACAFVEPVTASLSALAFAIVTIVSAMRILRKASTGGISANAEDAELGRLGAGLGDLLALTYAWGGLAMLLTYSLTGLHWRHGWQYGLGMLLIAVGIWGYGHANRGRTPIPGCKGNYTRVIWLVVLQGVAAAIALLWLVLSGKLATPKDDWAANIIFLGGGCAVAAISAMISQLHLTRTRRATHG